MLATGELAVISKIGYAEIYAALARRRREGDLSQGAYRRVCRSFEQNWRGYVRVEVRDDVLFLARDLVRRRPLRGFDAIHLGSALMLARELGEPIRFVAADARLLEAAAAENLLVMNPED
jgi:hypothetical protein